MPGSDRNRASKRRARRLSPQSGEGVGADMQTPLFVLDIQLTPHVIDRRPNAVEHRWVGGDVAPFNIVASARSRHPLALVGDPGPAYGAGAIEVHAARLHGALPFIAKLPGSAAARRLRIVANMPGAKVNSPG